MVVRVEDQRNRAILLLCALSVTALALDAWQSAAQRAGRQMWLDNLICATAAPVQSTLLGAARRVEAAWTAVGRGRRLAEENARLSAKVAELQARVSDLWERSTQADRERALRSAYRGGRRDHRAAHIIGVGAGGWQSYYVLDRGSAHGTRVQDVAVTREGVVGQVYAVSANTSRLLPITDPASGVGVRVQRTRETGILKGTGGWQCELRYLGPNAQVRPGDELLTAGLGGVFPKGLRVGRVVSVGRDPDTSGKTAVVEPAARLEKVEEVLLLRAQAAVR